MGMIAQLVGLYTIVEKQVNDRIQHIVLRKTDAVCPGVPVGLMIGIEQHPRLLRRHTMPGSVRWIQLYFIIGDWMYKMKTKRPSDRYVDFIMGMRACDDPKLTHHILISIDNPNCPQPEMFYRIPKVPDKVRELIGRLGNDGNEDV